MTGALSRATFSLAIVAGTHNYLAKLLLATAYQAEEPLSPRCAQAGATHALSRKYCPDT